ncbi:DUF3883 domain-containing protein [Aliifodinibius salicampi]|uniref:DUF3883 domain-containing protein n=1 Tax=Fodinibius salicampi TaxID=1920655 RepID=A0ABT3PXT0_9BACT|nr:DUF3883 domain-containing protein [Fodinibius salicampi]MCW9712672.1 DUF3883 domain-containing protein [Fodinibius salicampi]
MPTTQESLWQPIKKALSHDGWTKLQSIYSTVETEIDFDDEDLQPEATDSSQPAWKKNVRNVLQSQKSRGEVLHQRTAKYKLPTTGDDWSYSEVDATVKDYFEMLKLELQNKSFNKAAHNRSLKPELNNRSRGAVEFKHQNISSVLEEMGLPYINGYKPYPNKQTLLKEVIIDELQSDERLQNLFEQLAAKPAQKTSLFQKESDLDSVFTDPPDFINSSKDSQDRNRKGAHIDFAQKEAQNRKLGQQGEEYVISIEKRRLQKIGRSDLADLVEWTSKEKGDGYGYDITSFNEYGDEIFIEVKTTKLSIKQAFFVTANELNTSEELSDSFQLYRVYNFSNNPKVYILKGNLAEQLNLIPTEYRAEI